MSKQWKAITLDWDALALQDDDDECTICISTREAAILKALLITAYWPTRWDNLGDTHQELQERMARLDGRLDICSDVGGDSWISITALNALFKALFESLWDGSPTDINPDAPTGTWNTGDTKDRNDALCMAAMSLVDTICAMEMQALSNRYAGAMLIFAVLMFLIPGFATFGVLVTGALIGSLGYDAAMAALGDRQARLDVACCMFDALQGEAVTEAVLSDSLDSCGFTPGTNEAIVRDYVYESIQSTETYYAMIDAAGRAFVMTSVLGVNLCECGQCGFCGFDDPLYDMPYTVEYGKVDIEGNPANCVHALPFDSPPPTIYGWRSTVLYELPEISTVSLVSWDAYVAKPPGAGTDYNRTIELFDSSMVLQDTWADTVTPTQDEWIHDSESDTPVADIKYVRIRLQYQTAFSGDSEIRADNVRIVCS